VKTAKKKTPNQTSSIQTSIPFSALLRELSTNSEKILQVSALGADSKQMIQESVIMPSQVILTFYLYQEKENRLKQRNGLPSPTQGTTTSSNRQSKRVLIRCPGNREIVKPHLQGGLHASQSYGSKTWLTGRCCIFAFNDSKTKGTSL